MESGKALRMHCGGPPAGEWPEWRNGIGKNAADSGGIRKNAAPGENRSGIRQVVALGKSLPDLSLSKFPRRKQGETVESSWKYPLSPLEKGGIL